MDTKIQVFLGADVRSFKKAMAEAEKGVSDLAQKGKGAAKEIEAGAAKAGKAFEKTGQGARGAAAGMGVYTDAAGKMRDANGRFVKSADEAAGSAKRLGSSLGAILAPASIAFAGLTLGIGATVREFAKLEQVLNGVEAVSGATGSQMAALKAQAIALGAQTKFSATEAAEGMSELAKAGFTVEQTMRAIPGTLALAAAGGIGVAEAAEAAGAALNGFGLEADQAGKVADILAKTANISAVSVGDLQNSLKYIAPIASSTSQSIEEVSTMLAIMGNAGIKSEQAGTTTRSALISLVKPSKDAGEMLAKLGISIQDTQGRMLPLTHIVGQLRDKTSTLSEVQRANAISTIFGAESVSGLLAVMKKTPAEVAAAAAQVRAFDGSAAAMAATMNKGVIAALDEAQGAISTLAITLGQGFAPAVTKAAQGTQAIASGVSQVGPEMRGLITLTASVATAMTGAYAALALVGHGSRLAAGGVAALGLTMKTAFPWVGALSLAIGGLVVILEQMNQAEREAAQRVADEHKARVESVASAKAKKDALKGLVDEYNQLAGKSKRTKEEEARLKTLQDTIRKDYPGLVSAMGKAGEQHRINATAADTERAAIDKLIQSKIQLARIEANDALASLEATSIELGGVAKAQSIGADDPDRFTPGMVGANRVLQNRQSALESEQQKKAALAIAAQKRLGQLLDTASPPPVPTPTPGPAYSGGGDSGASGDKAAREAFNLAKEIAEQRAQLAEAEAARLNVIEKGRIDRKLSLLAFELDAGKINQQQYLDAVREVKQQEIAIETSGKLGKMQADREATQGALVAAKAAGKVKANEAKILAEKLKTIDAQMLGAEREGREKSLLLEQETNQQKAALRRAAVKELTDIERKQDQEIGNLEAAAANRKLSYFDRQKAEAAQAFDVERQQAQNTYQQAIEGLKQQAAAGVDTSKARSKALDLLGQKLTDIGERETETAGKMRDAWLGALAEMKNELAGLVSNPSADNLGSFGMGMLSDPEKMSKWGGAIKEAGDTFAAVTEDIGFAASAHAGAASKAFAGLSGSISGMLPVLAPVAGALAGWFIQFQMLKTVWEQLKKPADDLEASTKRLGDTLDEIGAKLNSGELSSEDALGAKIKAMKEHATELRKQLEKVWEKKDGIEGLIQLLTDPIGLVRAGNTINLQNKIDQTDEQLRGAQAGQINQTFSDDLKDASNKFETGILNEPEFLQAKADAVKKALESWIKVRDDAADPKAREEAQKMVDGYASLFKAHQEGATEARDAVSEYANAVDKATAALERQAEAEKELREGGRNERGEKITLEAEKLLTIQKQQKADLKAQNDLKQRHLDLQEELNKLNQDERDAIAGIENEGIAVRAKTEAQDKAARIEKVRADATERRADLTKDISELETDMDDARIDSENALARINNQYKERVDRLNEEIIKQGEILKILDQQAVAAARAASAASSGSSSSSSGSSSTPKSGDVIPNPGYAANPTPYTPKYLRFDGSSWIPAATGGMVAGGVPGRDSVPIMAMPGELITDTDLTKRLDAMTRHFLDGNRAEVPVMPGSMGGGDVHIGSITVVASPGMDEKRLARQVGEEVGRMVRRTRRGM